MGGIGKTTEVSALAAIETESSSDKQITAAPTVHTVENGAKIAAEWRKSFIAGIERNAAEAPAATQRLQEITGETSYTTEGAKSLLEAINKGEHGATDAPGNKELTRSLLQHVMN